MPTSFLFPSIVLAQCHPSKTYVGLIYQCSGGTAGQFNPFIHSNNKYFNFLYFIPSHLKLAFGFGDGWGNCHQILNIENCKQI